jgi:hypothetical protein
MFEWQRVEVLRVHGVTRSKAAAAAAHFGDHEGGVALALVAAESDGRDGLAAGEAEAEGPVVEFWAELQRGEGGGGGGRFCTWL